MSISQEEMEWISYITDLRVALGDRGKRMLDELLVYAKELGELRAEYDEAYAQAQDGAARMIWQSMQKGPGHTPDWDFKEVHRPGGGFFWDNGQRREQFDWPTKTDLWGAL